MSGFFGTPSIVTVTAKAPFDKFNMLMDFSNILGGDIIAEISSVTCFPLGVTTNSATIANGIAGASSAVQINIGGGDSGSTYTITINVETATGNQFSRSFNIAAQLR
jgi:hypothetical protein